MQIGRCAEPRRLERGRLVLRRLEQERRRRRRRRRSRSRGSSPRSARPTRRRSGSPSRLVRGRDDRLGERGGALPAVLERRVDLGRVGAVLDGEPLDELELLLRVGRELVDADDGLEAEVRGRSRCAARGSPRPPRSPRRRRRCSPPWCLSARTVATSTTTLGRRSPTRQVMSKNFSIPRSEAKPDSVIRYSPSLSPTRSATSELLPCAMFANGPQWTNASCPSSVWTRFGLIASFSSTVSEPAAWRSSAVTGSPSKRLADRDRGRGARAGRRGRGRRRRGPSPRSRR